MFIVSGTNYTLSVDSVHTTNHQSDDEIPEYSIAMLSELFDLLQKFPYQTAEVDGVKVRYQYGAVMINLQTPRLILRDYTEKDFEAYSRLKMDAETMYYLQDIQLHSVEEARRDFAEVLSDMKSPERKFYFCHMELKDTHEQVGSIGYTVEADTPVGKLVHLAILHIRGIGGMATPRRH